MSDPGAQTAGVGFSLSVSDARDSFNNLASGTVTVSFQDGGTHLAPDSTPPTLNAITVTGGSGSATQTLVLAESGVILRGTSGSVTDDTAPFTVSASSIASFTLSDPGAQTAGVGFSLSVSNAQDSFQNSASGTVTVSFQDGGTHLAP
ncbi:MAG: hypothetical protein ACE5HS_00990, partial [bacterium]